MTAAWRAGDLALCVDVRYTSELREGRVYTVDGLRGCCGFPRLTLVESEAQSGTFYECTDCGGFLGAKPPYVAHRFIKASPTEELKREEERRVTKELQADYAAEPTTIIWRGERR